ncbi:hypothetical protein CC2G_007855 [Coprinopsis cinerea AmutBmut pab1-1]|nr:hypothetical protein CC2G_007855 [Coprinopsis cinerea AmutBmut pab1-1]
MSAEDLELAICRDLRKEHRVIAIDLRFSIYDVEELVTKLNDLSSTVADENDAETIRGEILPYAEKLADMLIALQEANRRCRKLARDLERVTYQ